MRRRVLALVAAALAPALAGPARGARAQTIPARPGGSLSSMPGVAVDVPIVVDLTGRTDRLGSFAARLEWSPSVLRLDGAVEGTFGSITVNSESLSVGVFRFAGANPAGAGGAVVLAVLRFTPLESATTALQLTVSELFAAGSFADLLPSLSVTDGQYCPARGRFGDITGDGAANSADALVAVTHAVGLPVGGADVALGDVDGDGKTDTRDALGILSHAVGLPTPGFRIMHVAGGECSANPFVTLAVLPEATGALLPGQEVLFEARVSDASGIPQTAVGIRWRSTDASVATVDSVGRATAVAPGSATIWAIRDERDSAQIVVTVVARRTTHFVSAEAAGARNQAGTSALPFATLGQADELMVAGDTVRVGAGRYESASFTLRVVLIGQSGAVISGSGGAVGLTLNGAGRSEIHDLAIEGFLIGLQLGAVDTVVADGLRVVARGGSSTCYTAGVKLGEAWALILRRAQLVGDGRDTGCATGVYGTGNLKLLVVEDASITDFGSEGIYAPYTDSLLVRRSQVSFNGYAALYTYAYGGVGGRVPAPPDVAVVVEDSRFVGNDYYGFQVYNLRRLRVAHSVIDHREGYGAFDVDGNGSGYIQLIGDSILLDDEDWMYLDGGVDSVVVDSTRVVGAYDGDFYDLKYLRVTNSSFTELTCGDTFYLSGYPDPVLVEFDSVTVRGGGYYSQCQDGIYGNAYGTFNRTVWEDLDDVIDLWDVRDVTVTNSVFRSGYSGIQVYGYIEEPPRFRVENSAFTDVSYPIEAGYVSAVIDAVTMTRGYYGVETWGTGPDTVRLSTLTGIQYYAIDLEGAPAFVTDNTITGVSDQAIYLYASAPSDSLVVVNNSVACAQSQYGYAWGIEAYYGPSRIESNTVTGCGQGIYLYAGGTPVGAVVRDNTVTLSPSSYYNGIEIGQGVRGRVTRNTVSGGGPDSDGGIVVRGYSFGRVPWALVDSNTVQQVARSGIRAEYVDSIEVRGNLVEDVTAPYSYAARGGIGVFYNLPYAARIAGNTVRRSRSLGIGVNQLDTATVFVDSNAVSAADTAAVYILSGSASLRHNNVRNNAIDGVVIGGTGSVAINGNAFKGNARYAVNHVFDASVDITGNWWGVDGAPPGSPGADSVKDVGTDPSPLASEPTGLPPLAPPVQLAATAELVTLPAALARVGEAEDAARPAPPQRTLKPARAPRAEQPRRGRPVAAGEAELVQTRAARAALLEQRRAAAETARAASLAERDSARASRRAERASRRRVER